MCGFSTPLAWATQPAEFLLQFIAKLALLVCGVHSRPFVSLLCEANYTDRITRLSFESVELAERLHEP